MEESNMNKSDLITDIALRTNISMKSSETVINTIFDSMTDALVGGDKIEVRGFGSFVIKEYEGYTGRNPKTGLEVMVKSKKLPFFKVGKDLKEKVDI
jgi:integration host factor subunit beta